MRGSPWRTGPGEQETDTSTSRVDSNTTMATRTGTVAIAGQTFTVQQAGIDCKYDVKPDHYDAGPGPDDVRIDVKARLRLHVDDNELGVPG